MHRVEPGAVQVEPPDLLPVADGRKAAQARERSLDRKPFEHGILPHPRGAAMTHLPNQSGNHGHPISNSCRIRLRRGLYAQRRLDAVESRVADRHDMVHHQYVDRILDCR